MASPAHLAPPLLTYFDRPGRSSLEDVHAEAAHVRGAGWVDAVLSGLPGPTVLLNDNRQIVVCNQAASTLLRLGGHTDPEGLRIGEALGCVFVKHGPDGCGTAPQCRQCGLGKANRAFGLKPGHYDGEIRLRAGEGAAEQALTLSVHLSPLNVNGRPLRLCSLADLTATRRRESLENIFFHDVLNTAQAVQGAAELIPFMEDQAEQNALADVVSENAKTLVGEIQTQRDLLAAEDGTLEVPRQPEHPSLIAARVADLYRRSRFGDGRTIEVEAAAGDDEVFTSAVHLSRSVGNLLKNALEAARPGETIRIRVTATAGEVAIAVHNDAVMPASVQDQVFQRSFSTKARTGRGLGTYSAHLLVSRYLGGTVSFVSAPGEGTTFTIRLPRG
ncbi:MAG: HAMP domain-containing sensor histidine kinase [Acidobacteriota bacterium]|nr:HAMP domain-containing sensor histidine kinase [Acidobacteriota bacterium]